MQNDMMRCMELRCDAFLPTTEQAQTHDPHRATSIYLPPSRLSSRYSTHRTT